MARQPSPGLMWGYRVQFKVTPLHFKEQICPEAQGKSVKILSRQIVCVSAGLQVACIGQMVCAVLADTKAHAKRGAAAVKIAYEDLPDPIFTIEVCR